MTTLISKFITRNKITAPLDVDRLIISAFLHKNRLKVKHNALLSSYYIGKEDKDYKLFESLRQLLDEAEDGYSFEHLIKLFEFVISPADKIITGAIYTPFEVREHILSELFKKKHPIDNNLTIADLACGCGSFLADAAVKIHKITGRSFKQIFERNIFGLDIQQYSITRTALLLSLLALHHGEDVSEIKFNLFVGDALGFSWVENCKGFKGFTFVVGNPPYVCSRNIPDESKALLRNWSVCRTGHPDLYIPFFEIGMNVLKTGGMLGFITMNTFFRSLNGRALRSYFKTNLYGLRILDFGSRQIFNSRSTYTCICIIEKHTSLVLQYYKSESGPINQTYPFISIPYSQLSMTEGWVLQNVDILNKIESTGTPFGKLYKTSTGIATLKNSVYIFSPKSVTNKYYLLEDKGRSFKIEKAICIDVINSNKLTRVEDIDKLRHKLIFPYIYKGEKAEVISEEFFQKTFPNAYKYLLSKRNLLSNRDKGEGKYGEWFAFGRNQGLERYKYKLFFPHIAQSIPNVIFNDDENLLFYNGLAVVTQERSELLFLQKIMRTRLFWFYVQSSSKSYGSGYYSFSRNYIKTFGIYNFNHMEKEFIISQNNMDVVNEFVEAKYGIRVNCDLS